MSDITFLSTIFDINIYFFQQKDIIQLFKIEFLNCSFDRIPPVKLAFVKSTLLLSQIASVHDRLIHFYKEIKLNIVFVRYQVVEDLLNMN
jgi:hypothetical protein